MAETFPDHVPSPRTLLAWDGVRYQALAIDATGKLKIVVAEWRPRMYDAYVHLQDRKAVGTHGGAFNNGAWRTRDINTELDDTATICAIAANQITLQPGTYRCLITCPAHAVDGHQTRLRNITAAGTSVLGTTEYARNASVVANRSVIAGRFTLAVASVLEIQHQCITTQAVNGFGNAATFGTEVYTDAEFWREW